MDIYRTMAVTLKTVYGFTDDQRTPCTVIQLVKCGCSKTKVTRRGDHVAKQARLNVCDLGEGYVTTLAERSATSLHDEEMKTADDEDDDG